MQSMHPKFKEIWEVTVGKEKFRISGQQADILKRAQLDGSKATIWFGDFAIAIPYISTIVMISREPNQDLLPAPAELGPDAKRCEQVLNRIKQMRAHIGI